MQHKETLCISFLWAPAPQEHLHAPPILPSQGFLPEA